MKKSNVIIIAFLILCSIFLLWLWFYLSLNLVDYPFDLIVSIIWWAVVLIAILLIIRAENKRREAIRTIYVAPHALFNSERGIVACAESVSRVAVMRNMLDDLAYDFSKESQPDYDDFDYRYVVRSKKFHDGAKRDADDDAALGNEQDVSEDPNATSKAGTAASASATVSAAVAGEEPTDASQTASSKGGTSTINTSDDETMCMPEDAGDLDDAFAHVKWEGSVITINRDSDNTEKEFDSPRELAVLLLDLSSDEDDDDENDEEKDESSSEAPVASEASSSEA
mgnify:CR=1 FL=1|jgi:hypothetical protein